MKFDHATIDDVKKYWNFRPCNIRHSDKPIGSKEYFDEVEQRKYFVEPHIPEFAEFPNWKGKKVLEIGCGIGTDTISFARNGASVTAIDISEKSLEIAKKRAVIYQLEQNIRFICANSENLSSVIPIEPFDLIYSFGVIHHSPNPEKILSEVKKYAKPGTVVKVMVYHTYSWKVFWILMKYGKGKFWRLNDLIAEYSEAETGCPITFSYSKGEITSILTGLGYSIEKISIEHIFPYIIQDYVNYRYKKVWYFRWMPASLFHWLEHIMGWHLCITARIS